MKGKPILSIIFLFPLILISCGVGGAPTPPPETVYTQVAATVFAQSTQTALAMPTNTPTSSFTATPTVTETLIPTPTLEITQMATLTQSSFPTAYIQPTLSTGDAAAFGSQNPIDGTTVAAGSEFQIHWFIRNVGTTTWTKDYCLYYYGGTKLWGVTKVCVTKDVVPGKGWDVYVDAFAPTNTGEYINRWALYNSSGKFMFEVYLHFFVK
jgi:hypothetical protein